MEDKAVLSGCRVLGGIPGVPGKRSYLLTVCRYLGGWHRTENAGKMWQSTVTGKGIEFSREKWSVAVTEGAV